MTGDAIDELRRLAALGVEPLRVVDLCAGSGAVGLAIASEAAGASVTAVELSAEACAYARRNADAVARRRHRSRYELRQGDIADAASTTWPGRSTSSSANPPYIPLAAFESVAPEARDFDPPVALWSGDDGLDAIAVVAEVAARLLVDDGLVVCEHADVAGRVGAGGVRRDRERGRGSVTTATWPAGRGTSARAGCPRAAAAAGTMDP